MTILVTNDDGINAEGLRVLANAMNEIGDVYVVAPDRQRSAVGLSITLEHPLRIERLSNRKFSVNGMPSDCVDLAIHKLMEIPPELIVSGINDGQNIGYDIYCSGTVGAAMSGTMFGIPSIAVSIAINEENGNETWYDTAAQIAVKISKSVIKNGLPRGTLLNVNVPNIPLSDVKSIDITRHCSATYDIEIHHRKDPRGKEYFWVGGVFQVCGDHSNTDLEALSHNKISVTPLHLDLTDYDMMKNMSNWF